MNAFEKTIKDHLDEMAKNDKLFAKTYQKKNKSIEECCKYIINEARKRQSNGCASIPDDEVYGMAVHYYDEDDIKVNDAPKAEVKVSATPASDKTKKETKASNKAKAEDEDVPMCLEIPLFGE